MNLKEYLKSIFSEYRRKRHERRLERMIGDFWINRTQSVSERTKYIMEDGTCTLCGENFLMHDH